MRKNLLSLFFLLLVPCLLLGQSNFKIKGKVTDAKTGEPLIGANVLLKPSNLGASTDLDGNYSFDIPGSLAKGQNAELTASFVNYKKKTVTVVLDGNDITRNFALVEDIFQNEEIVVTGIASKTSKAYAEVAVSSVAATDLQKVNTYQSLSQLVQGKVAGVTLNTSSGNVGSGWRFNVRGGGGLTGTGQPTIYIDGVRVDNNEIIGYGAGGQGISELSNLNPNDIDKIEFLKGSAAAAMYGTGGSNGVVLITTKSGLLSKSGSTLPISVNYRFNYGYNEKAVAYSLNDFKSASDANGNFIKGPVRDHDLSIAGGFSALKYYASFNRREETGILPATNANRTSAGIKLTAVPNSDLNVIFSTNYSVEKGQRPVNDNSIYGWLGNTLLQPTSYLYTPEVSLRVEDDKFEQKNFRTAVSATYNLITNLEFYGSIGYENTNYMQQQLYPYGYYFQLIGTTGQKSIYQYLNSNYTYDFHAQYSWELMDKLNVTSIVGGQFFDRYNQTENIAGQKFGSPLITSVGSLANITGYGEGSYNTRQGGLYTEHSFNYVDQYFLTLGLKREYASVIGKDAPNIYYPKASFALRLDKYDFLPQFVNLAKFRIAYGETGALPGLTDGIPLTWTYQIGGYGPGAVLNSLGQGNIQPERNKEIETGLDFELFNNVSVEFTYYNRVANNSIVGFPLSSSTGKANAGTLPFNVGTWKAYGFETLVQYSPIREADYGLDLTLVWNYQSNEVTDLGGAQPIYAGFNSSNVVMAGLRKSEFYAPQVLGATFNTAGAYTGVLTTTSNVDLGSPLPDHSGSVTVNFKFLKNFSLYAFGEWGLHLNVYNYTKAFGAQTGNNPTRLDILAQMNAATPGTQAYTDIANAYAKTDGRYVSNYLEKADYFVIREVSLSYDFTDLLSDYDLIGIFKYITAGISARNIARFSKYTGPDFEINSFGSRSIAQGTDFLTLQTPRTFNFWVRLGF